MAEILHGSPVAAALTEALIPRCEQLKAQNVCPALAIVRIGARDDDVAYENAAVRRCEKVGISVRRFLLPEGCDVKTLMQTIDEINLESAIHGCLMFRPLRSKAAELAASERLLVSKDVDGMTRSSLAYLYSGTGAGFPPCTAQACMKLLEHYGIAPEGKHAVVLGRSTVVGKPLAMLLQNRNATVTVCHSHTQNEQEISRQADILIAAVGKAEHIDRTYLREGQILLDIGIHAREDGSLCGDVLADDAEAYAAAYAPSPGGVGSITTSILAEHVIEACEKQLANTQAT